MGEQSDLRREMEACCIASIEPATKQANRGSGADAVGNAIAADTLTRRAARADTQQASIALAIQLLPAFVCGVGSVCVKHTGVGGIGEPTTSQQAEVARAAAGRAALLPFGGGKDEHR